jgi:hypothetical protein
VTPNLRFVAICWRRLARQSKLPGNRNTLRSIDFKVPMDSFLKDSLSALILATWVLPAAYLTLALVAGRLLALYRQLKGDSDPRPPVRSSRASRVPAAQAALATTSSFAASAQRRNPLTASGITLPVARMSRPRVASRWKSSQRLTAGAC